MKFISLVVFLSTTMFAQSLVEHAAAAAGGTAGGAAGKKVSDALTNIFDKVDKTTAKAASDNAGTSAGKSKDASAPLFEVGPGVPHSERTPARVGAPSVPPPPPIHHAYHRPVRPVETAPMPAIAVPPPPPPQATAQDLKKIAVGSSREDLLKLGFPAIHITMYDNGHLLEIYRFVSEHGDVGLVRVTDGSVSNVQVN